MRSRYPNPDVRTQYNGRAIRGEMGQENRRRNIGNHLTGKYAIQKLPSLDGLHKDAGNRRNPPEIADEDEKEDERAQKAVIDFSERLPIQKQHADGDDDERQTIVEQTEGRHDAEREQSETDAEFLVIQRYGYRIVPMQRPS